MANLRLLQGEGPRTLADFVRQELARTEYGPLTMFMLVYPLDSEREVQGITITGESDLSPEQRAQTFVNLAEEDAKEVEKLVCTYSVRSYFANTGSVYKNRMSFKVRGGKENDAEDDSSPGGQITQAMRHKEDAHEGIIRMAAITFATLNQHSKQLAEDRHNLMRENMEVFGAFKDQLMKEALANHTFKMETLRYERNTALFKEGLALLPPALRMMGAPVPEGTADTALLNRVIDSIDPSEPGAMDSLQALLGKLDSATAVMLADRFTKRAEHIAREAAKKKKESEGTSASTSTNGTGGTSDVH